MLFSAPKSIYWFVWPLSAETCWYFSANKTVTANCWHPRFHSYATNISHTSDTADGRQWSVKRKTIAKVLHKYTRKRQIVRHHHRCQCQRKLFVFVYLIVDFNVKPANQSESSHLHGADNTETPVRCALSAMKPTWWTVS